MGAWLWETGVEYRIYPYELQRVRDEKKFLLSLLCRDSAGTVALQACRKPSMATSQSPYSGGSCDLL